jgi:hypothetical protein
MICIPVIAITTDAALEKIERAMRRIDRIMAGGKHNE